MSAAASAPRILFMARQGSVGELQRILRARATVAVYAPPKGRDATLEGYRRFSWGEMRRLRRQLRAGEFDLVLCHAPAEGLTRTRGFFLKRWLTTARKWLFNFGSLGPALTPWMLRGTTVPLVVYEWDDTTIVQQKHWALLDACRAYFKVNCPPNLYKAFLFQGARNDDVFNIVRQPVFKARAEKLRPLSLGAPDVPALREAAGCEKTADVFFAGSLDYTRVREEGMRQLEALRDAGYRIDVPEERLPPQEFYRRLASAWLAWSPEGAEWDTHRAYEAALVGSVPLLNYPTTRRYQPLEEGVHALYYGVEGDHLTRVIKAALEDRERLRKIAAAAQTYVETHHRHEHLADRMIQAGLPATTA